MVFIDQFWAPRKLYKPVGMFTPGHITLLFICLVILGNMLYFSRKITKDKIQKLTKVLAIVITTLEVTKIAYSFYWGYTWISEWFPIAYCSIFIYALWLSGYTKGKWRDMGDSFIAGGCIIGGTAFLLFPSTSLMIYPIWNYQCLYSMFFHTMMIYMGVMYIWKREVLLDKKGYKQYVKIYVFFAVIAIVINTICGSNLMMLRDPFNIPVVFIHKLVKDSPWIYTVFIFLAYLLGPYWVTTYFSNLIKNRKNRKNENNKSEQVKKDELAV